MIEAKELMIGNWVLANGKIEEMNCISKHYPFINSIEYGVGALDWKDIEPILLTEEWLVKIKEIKCINKKDCLYELQINKFRKISFCKNEHQDNKINVYLWDKWNNNTFELVMAVPIEYVHQLQNYYYHNKLTGEELIIKQLM